MTPSLPAAGPAALGLSVGATTLAARTADRAVTGLPVVSRGGLQIGDFVDRVGDPVGIVAPGGSRFAAADLLADALHDVARTASSGRPLPAEVAVAYPGHWRPVAVEALRGALRRLSPWSAESAQVTLIPDYVAALTALRARALGAEPELPDRGVVAVCDFGGSGTTITMVDLTDGLRAVGEPLRHPDFSGDLIDRVLVMHVLGAAGTPPGGTGTSSIGALTRLRTECRAAKERLSSGTATVVPAGPTGLPANVRVTRAELEEILRGPLAAVVAAVQDTQQRNGIASAELAAVVLVGGGAAIPAIATTLSQHMRVPVVSACQPGLAAAAGAALAAAGRVPCDRPTEAVRRPVVPRPVDVDGARAWSRASHIPEVVPPEPVVRPDAVIRPDPRPRLDFVPASASPGIARVPWHQRPLLVAAAALMVIAAAGGAAALALRADSGAPPALPSVVGSGEGPSPHGLQPALPQPALPEPALSQPALPESAVADPVGSPPTPRTVIAVAPPATPVPPAAQGNSIVPVAEPVVPVVEPVGPVVEGPAAQAIPVSPPVAAPEAVPLPPLPDLPPIPDLVPMPDVASVPDLAWIPIPESIPVLQQLLPQPQRG